jgi:hypothetical protein
MPIRPINPLPDAIAGDASAFPDAFPIRRHRYRPFLLAMILGIAALSRRPLWYFAKPVLG